MRPLHFAAALFAVAVPTLGACQLVAGYEAFSGGSVAATTPHPCDVLPASKPDARDNGMLALVKVADGSCHWVDRTEVTVEQYRKFVAGTPAPDWSSVCQWKATPSDPEHEATHPCSVEAAGENSPFQTTKPIRCVDWCDAQAYCEWAGGRLCYSGKGSAAKVPPAELDEWGYGCSPEGDSLPYGLHLAEKACNIGMTEVQCGAVFDSFVCAPASVGSLATCTSSAGAVDMVGNVAEWVDLCTIAADAGEASCTVRGGSYRDSASAKNCISMSGELRSARRVDLGFRCCADLDSAEQVLVQ